MDKSSILIIFSSVLFATFAASCFFYLIFSANVVYIVEERPSGDFNGDYTKQSELTTQEHGILSKLSTTQKTVRVGTIIDLTGKYEYQDTIYTVQQKREPITQTLKVYNKY